MIHDFGSSVILQIFFCFDVAFLKCVPFDIFEMGLSVQNKPFQIVLLETLQF